MDTQMASYPCFMPLMLLRIVLIRVAISTPGLLLYILSHGTLIYLNSSTSNSSFAVVDLQTQKLKVGLIRLCVIPYFKYPVGIDHRYSPRPGEEPKDEVCLHSEPSLIKKLKDELEKTTTDLCNCIVLSIQVLTTAHSTVIGCSGCNLINFQNKFNVQMQYPGSNSYKNAGPVNFFQLAWGTPSQSTDLRRIIYHVAVKASYEMAQAQGTSLKAYKPSTVESAISIVSLGWLFNLFAVWLENGLAQTFYFLSNLLVCI